MLPIFKFTTFKKKETEMWKMIVSKENYYTFYYDLESYTGGV